MCGRSPGPSLEQRTDQPRAAFRELSQGASRPPFGKDELVACGQIAVLDLRQAVEARPVDQQQADLLVQLERADVDIARSDDAELAVDPQRLRVQQILAIAVDADAASEQLLII